MPEVADSRKLHTVQGLWKDIILSPYKREEKQSGKVFKPQLEHLKMITGVKLTCSILYGVVLYGIILQYGMANSMEGCRMTSISIQKNTIK